MSGRQVGLVWELDVPPAQQVVLLALADSAHHDGSGCYPGVALLAWKTGYSPRNIQRLLRLLEDRELIEAVGFVEGGRGRTTEYQLHLDRGCRKAPLGKGQKGDKLSSAGKGEKGDKLSRREPEKGDNDTPERATDSTVKGDTQMSPQRKEPSGNQENPPYPPQGGTASGRRRDREQAALLATRGLTPLRPGDGETWQAVQARLRDRLGETVWGLWLEPAVVVARDGDVLLVGAPEAMLGWVRDRLAGAVAADALAEGVTARVVSPEEALGLELRGWRTEAPTAAPDRPRSVLA